MKKILVIEDDRIMRENIAELLELVGYRVNIAENGKQGIEKAQSMLPDLIVCDIKMPILDGFGVLHILQKKPQTAAIPFIFLTAKTEKKDIRQGMEMGADDYLAKPFEDTELLKAVEIRLKKSERIQEQTKDAKEPQGSFSSMAQFIEAIKNSEEDTTTYAYETKEIIYKEGAQPHYLFFIEKGQAKTFRLNKDGKELITSIGRSGDFLGYQAVLEERAYCETAIALQASKILKIPKNIFKSLMQKNKVIASEFTKMISKKLSDKEKQLMHMAYDSVRKRVAIKLLELIPESKSSDYSISTSRTDLASMVGTTTETIVRTLSELKDLHLIEADHHQIRIRDKEKLKEYLKQW